MSKSPSEYRVFVVDDEPIVATTLGHILRLQGYNVSSFTDPLLALQAVHANPPDLVITDVVMPGISGIELGILLRESHPNCIVMLFSGQISTSQLLDAAKDRGHNFEILAKPVPPAEILGRVRRGLGLDPAPDPAPQGSRENLSS